MITHSEFSFGPEACDRRAETDNPGARGAVAALETFYYALNNRDAEALAAVISDDALAQLNNPVGGTLRGGAAIVDLYATKIFSGDVRVEVTFDDFVQYLGDSHALFVGRETGTYTIENHEPRPLTIRTSRYFRNDNATGRWEQCHHHGSIDDPDLLRAYQRAILG